MGEAGSERGATIMESLAHGEGYPVVANGESDLLHIYDSRNYEPSSLFFADSFIIDYSGTSLYWGSPYFDTSILADDRTYYLVDSRVILGDDEADNEDLNHQFVRRCFNCGSTLHNLNACTEPIDRARVASAREAFAEHNDGAQAMRRIHQVGEEQARRLYFLDSLTPGRIQVPELRDALGLDDPRSSSEQLSRRTDEFHWYEGMMKWGYPPGYYSVNGTYYLTFLDHLCTHLGIRSPF